MKFLWTLFFPIYLLKAEYVSCLFSGQLCNQMFEIAAAVSYALDHGCEARFPGLILAEGAEENIPYIFHRLNCASFPENIQFEMHSAPGDRIYSPIPYKQGKHICLNGFFQSEKYFVKHKKAIQNLFAPSDSIVTQIQEKYGELLKSPTVAIHVRTFIPDGWDPFYVFKIDYYLKAMSYFPDGIHFLVFTDAMEWTKKHFRTFGKKVTFIEGNPPHIDFYLMSMCDHQIISYFSTFSWWAAWLNQNPNKIVIAPSTWKRTLAKDDFIPDDWIQY